MLLLTIIIRRVIPGILCFLLYSPLTYGHDRPTLITIIQPDITKGIIGSAFPDKADDPSDNIFHFHLEDLPCERQHVVLVFEVYGVADRSSMGISINDEQAMGGQLIRLHHAWIDQKHPVNPASLRAGNNVLRFTAPKNTGVQYQVRKVRLEVVDSATPWDQRGIHLDQRIMYENGGVVSGYLTGRDAQCAQLFVNEKPVRNLDATFDHYWTQDFSDSQCITFRARFADGEVVSKSVTLTSSGCADIIALQGERGVKSAFSLSPLESQKLRFLHATLDIPAQAVEQHQHIKLTALRTIDVSAFQSGVYNTTAYASGYRCLPHGMKFSQAISISLEYDPMRIPSGYTEEDLRIFYFNETRKKWEALPQGEIHPACKTITAYTDHFTDFIAGVIRVPETPETESFLPTTLNSIPQASPVAGIDFIQPPSANGMGSARTSFPISVPEGRSGMTPSLAVMYDSENGNGWCGLGWDIGLSRINVETRWGVPRYLPDLESETYLLDGTQLASVAHRHTLQNRSAEKQFYRRVEGAFERIIRHGNTPKNYWWEITDKTGTRRYYGGRPGVGVDQTAVLKDATGNIAQWCLTEERDLNDNSILYTYSMVQDPGITGGSVAGFQIYPKEIRYTGHGAEAGPYLILFTRDRELGESRRPDVGISARMGFKQVNADLLRKIEIVFRSEPIRSYTFEYQTGAFFKSLLSDIVVLDETGQEFYRHTMDYHDDVRSGGHYMAFRQEEMWNAPADDIRGNILTGNPLFPNETSVLGGSSNTDWSVGGALTVGPLGNLAAKTNTAGGNYTYGSSSGHGLIAFVDINGDGLPDKVYHKANKLSYRPNLTGQGGQKAFGEERLVQGLNQFSKSKTTSSAVGAEAHPAFAFVGYTHTTVNTSVSTYFSDFNGDGLIDIVFEGKVYFNHINANGDPVFTLNSGDTPSPIELGAGIDDNLFTIDSMELEDKIDASPLHDVVRMWEAPFGGQIRIAGPVRLIEDPSPESQAYDKKDGVSVTIQVNGAERWRTTIEPDDFAEKTPANVGNVSVNLGDRIYFRVQSRFDGAYDQVHWNPEISYLTQPIEEIDANGKPNHLYTASQDFLLASAQVVSLPLDGTIKMEGAFQKPITSDDVRLHIYTVDDNAVLQILLDTIFAWDSTVFYPLLLEDIIVEENDELYLKVLSRTQVEWPAIQWMPLLSYTAAADGSAVTSPDGTPLITYCPSPEYQMYNDPLRKTRPWIAASSGIVTVHQALTFNGTPNGTMDLSLKGVKKLYGVQQVNVNNGVSAMTGTLQAEVEAGDTLYVEYHTTDRALALEVQDARAALVLIGTDTVATGLHTERDSSDIIFGPLYRGWGHFVYNGNRDRADMPINEAELMIDDDIADGAGDIEDIDDPDDIDITYSASSEPFILMIADPKRRQWVGSDNLTFIRSDTMSSSRFGEDDLLPPSFASDGTTFNAPSIMTQSKINSVAGGVSVGPGGAGGSIAFNTTHNLVDVIDLNGDSYPDIVTTEMVQYTTMRGGLEDAAVTHTLNGHEARSFAWGVMAGVGYVYSSATNSGNESKSGTSVGTRGSMSAMSSAGSGVSTASRRSAASSGSAGSARSQRSGSVKSNVSKSGKKSSDASRASRGSAGIGGDLAIDRDSTSQTWMDINGDGLTDMLFSDGTVALNLGYGFAAKEQWGFPVIHEGESRDYGGGLGINLFNGSIMAGVSINRTDNHSERGLIDLNGDGLVDLVTGLEPLKVRLNTGSGFAPEVTWGGAAFFEQGTATGESINGAFTVCIPIPIFGIRICVNPSTSTGRGVSRITQQLGDADGDGFLDYLRSNHDGEFFVSPSAIGQTNLLKTIHRPLGAKVHIRYDAAGNSYDLPYARWVLSEVAMDDGLPGDGADIRKTVFRYAHGRHGRHEREFYGFGRVEMQELDTENNDALYRYTVQEYHTGDYYSKGLLLSEKMYDAAGNPFYETRHTYSLRDISSGTALPPVAAQDDAGMAFPALLTTTHLYFEGQPDPGLQTTMHYQYDVYGNVIRYTDTGDGTDADQHITQITYHDDDMAYLKAIPKSAEVLTSGVRIRYSEQDIDARGNITQLRNYLTGNEAAITDFDYDPFGNIVRLEKPANVNGERMSYDMVWDEEVHTYPVQVSDSYGYTSSRVFDFRYGKIIETTDINESRIIYTLDEKGRLKTITGPYELNSGATYSLGFDYQTESLPAYSITKRFDPEHQQDIESILFADGLGRDAQVKKTGLIHTGTGAGSPVMVVSGADNYDAFGRIVESYYPVTETSGFSTYNPAIDGVAPTIIVYDVLDRSIATVLPDGATTTVAFGILPDNIGLPMRAATTTDALGNITARYQDVRERVRSEMAAGPNGEIWTNYHYNAISELLQIEDTESNATVYTYDQLGRRTVIHHPDAGVTSFEFDLAGNLLRKITDKIKLDIAPTGAIEYTYDHERLIKIEYPKNFQNTVQLHYGAPGAEFNRSGRLWLREDASGGEEYFYGPQGETIKTIRTLLISQSNVHTYVTEYRFDTWGRIQELRYPDGEVVSYDYDIAGKLTSIAGRKTGIEYSYIRQIGYDKFGDKAFLHFGNGVQTTYDFAPDRRWLRHTNVSSAAGSAIIDNTYSYDAISNLLSLSNNAPGTPGQPGGTSSHSYTYDELHRLITGVGKWSGTEGQQSTYALHMQYDDLHNILAKEQIVKVDGKRDPLKTYQFNYTYAGANPHAPSAVAGRRMVYDASGNLAATRGETAFTFSQLLWDEENRLRGVSNNGYISHYTYDALGERAIKSHGGQQGVFVDGAPAGAIDHLDQYTAYVNPYFSVENDRFTKHYFAGEMKVLSKIGTGKFNFSLLPGLPQFTAGDLNYSRRMQLLHQAQDAWYTALGIPPGPPTVQGYYGQPEYTGIPLSPGSTGSYNNPPAHWPGPPGPPDPDGPPGPPVWYAQPLTRDDVHAGYGFDSTATQIFKETDAFFYHQDHVGSTHYLTDWIGEVRQHTEYIPFGEVFVDQHTSSDAHPYKFNGKELDEETGYYYFGARYYDPRLSLWNSVDPLAEKFPAWSPYSFSFQNPVRYNDPDGREPDAVINAIAGLGYVKVARDYFEGFTQSTSYSFDHKPDRVFWSGGSVAMNTAKQYAAAHHAISLEMTQEGLRLEKMTNTLSALGKQEGQSGYFGFLSTENFWKQLSRGFASGATGDVTAVLRKSAMRKDNIYEKDERPILQKNLMKFKGMTLKEKTIE